MGYMHISNLYRPDGQDILLFKECYALEKIHGTSAHITWKRNPSNSDHWQLIFFGGGTKHETFVSLFDKEKLTEAFKAMNLVDRDITVYGESYGGKEQGMSETYGKVAKFIVFDVMIGECFLSVPEAEAIAKNLGLEFVHYVKVSTDLAALDAQRDHHSIQAVRNGITTLAPNPDGDGHVVVNPKKREGVVLRPLIELRKNNGDRVMSKHKGDDFKETKTSRPVVDPAKMQVLADAEAVATEWVTKMRLEHVLDKIPGHCMERMREVIAAMTEDVMRESSGEIVESEAVKKAIGKKTALAYKEYLQAKLHAAV